jgi:hypothetical protein
MQEFFQWQGLLVLIKLIAKLSPFPALAGLILLYSQDHLHMGCTTLHMGCTTLYIGCTALHVDCKKNNSLLACYI